MRRPELSDAPERRAVDAARFEVRAADDPTQLRLTGCASVFGTGYDVMGGPSNGLGWTERVDPGAFRKTLAAKPDLHLLVNHEGLPLARTKSGTLRLSTDARGLQVEADLDRSDPDVQRLETKMRRGDLDEMSFAFRVKADRWTNDKGEPSTRESGTIRTLTEVSLHKGDVSVVNWGANPATSASLRSVDAIVSGLLDLSADDAVAEIRSSGTDVARLVEARAMLDALIRTLTPKTARTMSLRDALALVNN